MTIAIDPKTETLIAGQLKTLANLRESLHKRDFTTVVECLDDNIAQAKVLRSAIVPSYVR